MPFLCEAFAYNFTYRKVTEDYLAMKSNAATGGELGSMHAIISALKAVGIEQCHRGVDECRQCCGGHGFLKSVGISFLQENVSALLTLEGEGAVML